MTTPCESRKRPVTVLRSAQVSSPWASVRRPTQFDVPSIQSEQVSPAKRVRRMIDFEEEVVASPTTPHLTPEERKRLMLKNLNEDVESGYHFLNTKLGVGGFSKVQLARHKMTGTKVAIKCMDRKKLAHDAKRVQTEVNALKALRGHTSICSLYQMIEKDDKIFLVMELLEGGELFDFIVQKGRLTESDAAGIISQLLGALVLMHQKGFAHSEIKPENVLIASTKSTNCSCRVPLIKMIDFGLCADEATAQLSDGTKTHINALETCCGTPSYAAPELLSFNGTTNYYNGRLADVWSLGVLSYALLVGRLPFDHENMTQLYKMIKGGLNKSTLPFYLSQDSKEFIMACLTRDPAKRPTTLQLMEMPLLKKYKLGCRSNDCKFGKFFLPGQSMNSNINEEAIRKVKELIPSLDYNEIRQIVRDQGLDYVIATYYMTKESIEGQLSINSFKDRFFVAQTSVQSPSRPSPLLDPKATKKASKAVPPRLSINRPAITTPYSRTSAPCTPARTPARTPLSPVSEKPNLNVVLSPNSKPFNQMEKSVMSPRKPIVLTPSKIPVSPRMKLEALSCTPQKQTPLKSKGTPSLFKKILNSVSASAKKKKKISLSS